MGAAIDYKAGGAALYGDTSRVTADRNVDVKTQQTKPSATPVSKKPPEINQSGLSNVLNSYRSYTYNFTLAGLKKERVNDPESYRNSELELVILKSAGKGTQGISNLGSSKSQTQAAQTRAGDPTQGVISSKNAQLDSVANRLIEGFNKESPGRFDMFIDNFEAETLMGFKDGAGTTLPTKFRFEVFEPYSVNGFIEALHTAAVAAGYSTYVSASFLLKMEFVGYPDDADITAPRLISGTERYFVLRFTGIEVQITERGTRYQCTAIPFNESGFGQPSELIAPVSMTGKTVQQILTNLMNAVTEDHKKSQIKSRNSSILPGYDQWKIEFPTRDDKNAVNRIGSSDVNELGVDNVVYRMPDSGVPNRATDAALGELGVNTDQQRNENKNPTEPASTRYNPDKPTVQFQEGKQIYECIENLIRDSTYVRKILKNIGQPDQQIIDEYGMVNYFLIKMEVTNQDIINDLTKNPYKVFTYVVTEYKVHYTRIPQYAQAKIDISKLKMLSLREYNYIYTGKNLDILNFKLNFNTLFFEAIPRALGNNDAPAARDSLTRSAEVGSQTVPVPISDTAKDQTSSQGSMPVSSSVQVMPYGASAAQRQDDPYFVMARNMHNAIINSKASMIVAELEIIGDPLYLVTGGIGNYNPKRGNTDGITDKGEADFNFREVLITVNFRNPIDISSLNKGGKMFFENKKVPFSGLYRVLQVNSVFKEGQFKQTLSIVRLPGQIISNDIVPTDIASIVQPYEEPENEIVEISPNAAPSTRADEMSLVTTLGRGLPNPGLPGELSNFAASAAGAGQTGNSLLNQVSGAVTNGIGKLTAAAGVFGGSIPGGVNQLATGIRLQAAGLINLTQANLSNLSLIGQSANTIQSQFPVVNAATALATDIATKATNITQLVNFPGSGIGQGATVSLNPLSDTAAGAIAQGTAAAQKLADQLGGNVASKIAGLGSKAAGLVNGVADKVTALTSVNIQDPTNLAAKFGINPSQLSGLSPALQSKIMDQLTDLAKKVPPNVDLSAATTRGLVLDYVSADNLANIPATAPYSTAPAPAPDQAFLSKLNSPEALARAFGVSDVSKISQELLPTDKLKSLLTQMPSSVGNSLSELNNQFNLSNVTAAGDKISSAARQISSITGIKGSVEGALNSIKTTVGSTLNSGGNLASSAVETFGSKTKGTSPLDKIMLAVPQTLPGSGVN